MKNVWLLTAKTSVIFWIPLAHAPCDPWASKAQCLDKVSTKFILPFLYLRATPLPTPHTPNFCDSNHQQEPLIEQLHAYEKTHLFVIFIPNTYRHPQAHIFFKCTHICFIL